MFLLQPALAMRQRAIRLDSDAEILEAGEKGIRPDEPASANSKKLGDFHS